MININNISDAVAVHGSPLGGVALQGEITPAHSVVALASLELSEVRQTALEETMEEIGLSLGSRLKDQKSIDAEEYRQRRQQLLVKLIEQVTNSTNTVLQQSIPLNLDIALLASKLRQGELSVGQQILLLAAMIAHSKNNPLRRHSLSLLLEPLLEGAGWEIELFGSLEFGTKKSGELGAVKQLFAQSIDQDEISVAEWFAQVSRWPQRQQRVRVLMRAIAFDLSCQPPSTRRTFGSHSLSTSPFTHVFGVGRSLRPDGKRLWCGRGCDSQRGVSYRRPALVIQWLVTAAD